MVDPAAWWHADVSLPDITADHVVGDHHRRVVARVSDDIGPGGSHHLLVGADGLGKSLALGAIASTVKRSGPEWGVRRLKSLPAPQKGKRWLILGDDLDRWLDEHREEEAWTLRDALSRRADLVLVATARTEGQFLDYQAPFFQFLATHTLRPLPWSAAQGLLQRQALALGVRLEAHPTRLRAAHFLARGNPRAMAEWFEHIALRPKGTVLDDLVGVLDHSTGSCVARRDALSPQMRRVVDALGRLWAPSRARMIGAEAGLSVSSTSAQLERLCAAGVVAKVRLADPNTGRASRRQGYELTDRLQALWLLLRGGGREALAPLAGYLERRWHPKRRIGPRRVDKLLAAPPGHWPRLVRAVTPETRPADPAWRPLAAALRALRAHNADALLSEPAEVRWLGADALHQLGHDLAPLPSWMG